MADGTKLVVSGFLVKPFRAETFAREVTEVLGRRETDTPEEPAGSCGS
ncbi:MAG: hypothetical protein P8R42_07825 [Candidatus Binatia bacterium]|nr:hypothetical protein [Candidatus Binatia bacterium]